MPKDKPLQDFIEDYVEAEPLTPEFVKWATKKYFYMNYEPSNEDKLRMYEGLLFDIAKLKNTDRRKELQKLLLNISKWATTRLKENLSINLDQYEQRALENETFYNLRKTI